MTSATFTTGSESLGKVVILIRIIQELGILLSLYYTLLASGVISIVASVIVSIMSCLGSMSSENKSGERSTYHIIRVTVNINLKHIYIFNFPEMKRVREQIKQDQTKPELDDGDSIR